MRNRFIFILVILIVTTAFFGIGIFGVVHWAHHRSPSEPTAEEIADRKNLPQGVPLPVLWDAPAFAYPDQNGHRITKEDLHGYVWIADFFFSSCTTICPIMTARMSQLQKSISTPKIHFVSFSVDPDHDTPAVLKQYSRMWEADDSRWHFLSTEKQKLAETAAGMRTFVHPPDGDTQIQHSSIFILVDGNGKVRGIYDGTDSFALRRLTVDAVILSGAPTANMPAAPVAWSLPEGDQANDSPGAVLYVSRGCIACHAQGRIAPTLKGCFGRTVLLDDGRSVLADEAYIRESIFDPNAKIVAGYARLMPSYRGQLTEEELSQLVDYIKSLRGGPSNELLSVSSQPTASGEVVDPVCKMLVPAHDPSLHIEFEGKTYYFCSPTCRDQFLKNPSKFVTRLSSQPAVPSTGP